MHHIERVAIVFLGICLLRLVYVLARLACVLWRAWKWRQWRQRARREG